MKVNYEFVFQWRFVEFYYGYRYINVYLNDNEKN